MHTVTLIHDGPLEVKEYKGQRVVTFKDIDRLHQRPEGTAKRNFGKNKHRFVKDVDYFEIAREDVGDDFVPTYGFDPKAPRGYLMTEFGYLMLVKSLNDDLAWVVQRELMHSYFRGRINPPKDDYWRTNGLALPDKPSDRDIARQFLAAIRQALESGEYFLAPKGKWSRPSPSGILLGVCDDAVITLISSRAYEIYARALGLPVSIQTMSKRLRPALARAAPAPGTGRQQAAHPGRHLLFPAL